MKARKTTIRDIAERSGVSVATVSRVINDNGRFSEETRKRVEAVIAETQYTTNMAGRTLRQNKSSTIGMLVPDITNELFAHIVLETEKFFFSHGYSLLVCNTNEEDEKERAYFKKLEEQQVDGCICILGSYSTSQDMFPSGIPIVFLDRRPAITTPYDYVESDHYLGAYIATELLIQKGGCKSILILSRKKEVSTDVQRLQGYRDALKDNGLSANEQDIIRLGEDAFAFEESRDIVYYLIKKGRIFDGIFATNDLRAHGALVALQQNHIAVPGQVKLVGFDGVSVSKYCYPSITTILQNKKELALQASEMLLCRINNEDVANNHLVIPISLEERETT